MCVCVCSQDDVLNGELAACAEARNFICGHAYRFICRTEARLVGWGTLVGKDNDII